MSEVPGLWPFETSILSLAENLSWDVEALYGPNCSQTGPSATPEGFQKLALQKALSL